MVSIIQEAFSNASIFLNENYYILVYISLKFVPHGFIENKLPLCRIIAWCWIDDKHLSPSGWHISVTHIYVTTAQNPLSPLMQEYINEITINSSPRKSNCLISENYFSNIHFYININISMSLQWRHNGCDCVSNHQPHDCFSTIYSDTDQWKHQSSALLALCAGNSPEAGEFPAQMAGKAENACIWWRHHGWSRPTKE